MGMRQNLIATFLGLGVILIILGIVYQKNDTIKPESTFDLNPTKQAVGGSTEPTVTAWRTYSNLSYNFSIDVPEKWYQEEYPAPPPTGSFVVAFGPEKLPCSTCSYFHNGYYSVRIYNGTTDPDYYKDFQARMANIGKVEGYQGIQLGENKGVMSSNTLAIEHLNNVYELTLDMNAGNSRVNDSKLFQHAVTTFKFTGLTFGN